MKIVLLLAALNSLTGNWLGNLQLGEKPIPVRVQLVKLDNGELTGTLSLPLEGLNSVAFTRVAAKQSDLSLEYKSESVSFLFEGAIKGKSISGIVSSKDRKGTFDLVRTVPVKIQDYFGAYEFDDGEFVYIRTWDELGENQLAYLSEDGNVGPLHAVSETEFFTGPGLWVPLPEQATVKFDFGSSGRITGLKWFEQKNSRTAMKREPIYREEEITFANAGTRLSGSLVLPKGDGPFPAMVLVHGSGPVTRDFFGPISYLFAKHGIAVLSYDKRGIGKSEGHWMAAGFSDYAADVAAGVAFLKSQKQIDSKLIGLWGASQAGWIIPQVAERDPTIAFAVMLSVPGVTPLEQELQRMRGEMIAKQAPETEITKAVAGLKGDIESLRSAEAKQHLEAGVEKLEKEGNRKALNASGPDNPRFLLWYTDILDYSPVPSLEKMKCPVLVLYGELDRGVPIDPNQKILKAAFQKGGNSNVTFRVFPKGNHALLMSETGSMAEFPHLTRFVPGLFPAMIEWIEKINPKPAD